MTDRMGTAMDIRDDMQKSGRTLWSRLRRALSFAGRTVIEGQTSSIAVTAPSFTSRIPAAAARGIEQAEAGGSGPETGILLHFPIHGEALLVKLADLLRKRVANRGFERDPLLLMMSRCPGSRLSIDRIAYIDFLADRSMYHVVIEAAPDAKISLDTTDFDTVVDFVVQYVTERISRPVALEAAS